VKGMEGKGKPKKVVGLRSWGMEESCCRDGMVREHWGKGEGELPVNLVRKVSLKVNPRSSVGDQAKG